MSGNRLPAKPDYACNLIEAALRSAEHRVESQPLTRMGVIISGYCVVARTHHFRSRCKEKKNNGKLFLCSIGKSLSIQPLITLTIVKSLELMLFAFQKFAITTESMAGEYVV